MTDRHLYFQTIFAAARPQVDEDLLQEMASLADATKAAHWRNTELPSLEEINTAIRKLQTGKAPGADGIPEELFKFGCAALAPVLRQLGLAIWQLERLPSDWAHSELLPTLHIDH